MPALDLFGIGGQSNAEGRGSSSQSPSTAAGLAYEITATPAFKQLADPVGGASTGSAWPAFANALTSISAVPCAFSEAAVSGSGLLSDPGAANGDWSTTGSRFGQAISRWSAAISRANADGWTPRFSVVWHQGEHDAVSFTTMGATDLYTAYLAAFKDLHARFETALGIQLKTYVFRVGAGNPDDDHWKAVRDAQDQACADVDRMVMVYTDTVNFPSYGWMKSDGLHYTQTGLNAMGSAGALIAASDLGYSGAPPRPPRPQSSQIARRLLTGV